MFILRMFLFTVVAIGLILLGAAVHGAFMNSTGSAENPQKTTTNSVKTLALAPWQIKQKTCIEEALFFEARGEGVIGMLAVLTVIDNRKRTGRWGNDWCKVIQSPFQFSYRNSEKFLKNTEKSFEIPLQISDYVRQVLTGKFIPALETDVLYYHNTAVQPKWSESFVKVATINRHIFYKEKHAK